MMHAGSWEKLLVPKAQSVEARNSGHVQSETRQKQFCEDLLRDVRKEMAQFKETIQTVVRSKEISDMAKQRLKEAVDAEQQRMQKLLETVSTTILNNIPDQLEQKFEAKLDATIQKKLLPSLGSSVDAKLERCVKDGLRQQLQGVLPQLEAAVQRSVEQARTSLQTDEVNRSLRPDVLGPNISRALADQEQVIVQTVTDPLCRVLPKAVERAVEAQLSQALPKMLQQLMTEVLTKMANKGGAREGDGPAPPPAAPRVTKEDILVLLKAKDYEKAFNTVLGLSSIDMVEWLCGQLSVRDVFEGEECLSNPVILSLIHQLAWALNNETQMKLYWLQEALVALNPQDSIIKHHVPEVLGQVTLLLEKFFDASSEAGQRKSARALMMMVKSVVQDI